MDDSVARFWDKCIERSKAYQVKESVVRWYVIRVEEYIDSNKSLRLNRHSASEVSAYLEDIGRKNGLKDWQYTQVVMALRILFVDIVKTDWAPSFPWDDWIDSAKSLPLSHPTIVESIGLPVAHSNDSRKKSLTSQIQALYPAVFERLTCEIRQRHYSIRTEQVYVSWVVRFIVFNNKKNPEELVSTDMV